MKTIPKFTDLIARAKEFKGYKGSELTKFHSAIHHYTFDNGYTASLVMWNSGAGLANLNDIECSYWRDAKQTESNIITVNTDKDLREFLERVEKL